MLIRLNVGIVKSMVAALKDEGEILVSVPDRTGVVKVAAADGEGRLGFMTTRNKPGNSVLGDPAIISHNLGLVAGFGWAKRVVSSDDRA